jgi:hypothetical protein
MIRLFAVPAALITVIALAAQPAEATVTASGRGVAAAPAARVLSDVTCVRSTSCWAVGDETKSGATRTLIEHWNGRKWSLTVSPNVARSADTFLKGVSCSARLNCWAVGAATLGSTKQEPIAERWNGRKWSLTVLPEPAGLSADVLAGISCPGATRCWAVGSAAPQVAGAALRPLAEHWTGKKWSVVPTRASGTFSVLAGVFCRRDAYCWAVGAGAVGTLIERWNGRRWSVKATMPTGGGLSSVWCPRTDCFATGNGGYPSAIAARWDGRKWSLTPTATLPQGTISTLPGVSCTTSVNCFAVGSANNGTLIERWRISKWVKVKSPNPTRASFAFLTAVTCLSPKACWAVGASAKSVGPESTLAERWTGSRWAIVRTP